MHMRLWDSCFRSSLCIRFDSLCRFPSTAGFLGTMALETINCHHLRYMGVIRGWHYWTGWVVLAGGVFPDVEIRIASMLGYRLGCAVLGCARLGKAMG